jgi:hypothetical protein
MHDPAPRLATLTDAQLRAMREHAREWIGVGLATGAADRTAFVQAARECYQHARLPWHHNVVWVSSPLVMALAVPIAARAHRSRRSGFLRFDVYNPLLGAQGDCGESVIEIIRRRIYQAVHGAVTAAVEPAVHRTVLKGVGSLVEQAVDRPLHHATRLAVDRAVNEADLRRWLPAVQEAVRHASGQHVPEEALHEALSSDNFAVLHGSFAHFSGQFGVSGAAYHAFVRDVCALGLPGEIWARSRSGERAIRSACWWYAHRDFVMVCERPRAIHLEPAGSAAAPGNRRLHHTGGPALVWPDGWGLYSVHGVAVPDWIIEHPERITVLDIERCRNAEVRRVMLDAYGWTRYIAHCGAEVVDQVPMTHKIVGLRGARLLRKDLPGEPEPLVYLDMQNSTAEDDGSHRRYLERIDPKAYGGAAGQRCHAAMASRWHHRDEHGRLQRSFARWQDYRPHAES